MRSASAFVALAALLLTSSAFPRTEALSAVHQQRYAMGTMFDIVVYHPSRKEAERAVENALAEVLRLDDVMSHYKAESALSRVNRDARSGPVRVPPELYDVISEAVAVSRLSGGRFDVTIAPLLRAWKDAAGRGERPVAVDLEVAQRCVGYDNIELTAPDRIRFRSQCTELDLGGIGKGYAVDRAMALVRGAGMEHAMINAGGSSISATGAAPGRTGWPVRLSDGRVLLLQDRSLSTSQQDPAAFGDIIDPQRGTPAASGMTVSVVAARATVADALSTTLVMLTSEEAAPLLAHFGDVSALWLAPSGELHAGYRLSALDLADAH